KDFPKALEDLTKALEIDPNCEAAYSAQANIWSVKKEYDKMLADLTKVIQLNPQNDDAYAVRGWGYLQKKMSKESLSDLNRAIELNAKSYNAIMSRAELQMTEDDATVRNLDAACADARKACELTEWK